MESRSRMQPSDPVVPSLELEFDAEAGCAILLNSRLKSLADIHSGCWMGMLRWRLRRRGGSPPLRRLRKSRQRRRLPQQRPHPITVGPRSESDTRALHGRQRRLAGGDRIEALTHEEAAGGRSSPPTRDSTSAALDQVRRCGFPQNWHRSPCSLRSCRPPPAERRVKRDRVGETLRLDLHARESRIQIGALRVHDDELRHAAEFCCSRTLSR